ncbi:MAG: hypothetical protein FJY74_07345 [Candidatus Eisenbacteria bacterium]|nr:hypothetical protein [Candidatus Eisenbacteria bacterium]
MRNCFALFALLGVIALAMPAGAQIYLDFAGSPVAGVARDAIPGNCSEWHELFPNFCVIHHQDDYVDNGDGIVSVCDVIILSGMRYHVDWVGPTYELENVTTGEMSYWEPTVLPPLPNPYCSVWHQVAPDFCFAAHVDEWQDNGDGRLSECDIVWIGGFPYHVASINLDITVSEEPSPTGPQSWSKIKGLFRTF